MHWRLLELQHRSVHNEFYISQLSVKRQVELILTEIIYTKALHQHVSVFHANEVCYGNSGVPSF